MSKTLIVGSEGGQGKRYQAILNFIGKEYYRRDMQISDLNDGQIKKEVDGIIIATPTHTHAPLIRHYLKFGKPILVEKPLCTNINELELLLVDARDAGTPISMICQYRHIINNNSAGESYYDYFRHGNDGLIWDCLQIIGLARGNVSVKEKSPFWNCCINGKTLSIQEMDDAYITEVREWLSGYGINEAEILRIHKKVAEFEARQ